MASQNWQSERKRLEGLSQEERRKNYYCGDKFIPLSEIPTWKEYFLENEKSLTEKGNYITRVIVCKNCYLIKIAMFQYQKKI